MISQAEQQEKQRVTIVSVLAAVILTSLKLSVGLLTGSLGLLSEAAHSGLDLVASFITLISVRVADRPADENHPYGHGRIENLSATIQGILLFVTASAIVYESIRRIFFVSVPIEGSIWAFVVMATSIGIDLWRSRMLAAAARRYNSKALEADALNFRADMLSSAVVIIGLGLTAYGARIEAGAWLEKADAVAALFVALVIITMSGRLAFQAVSVLVDHAPATLREQMTRAVATVPGVISAQPVRVRESGRHVFADVVVTVPRTTSLAESHTITEQIEAAVRTVEPRTETVVHVEPVVMPTETVAERIRVIAQQYGIATHHEQVYQIGDQLEATFHIEAPPHVTLRDAYAQAQQLVKTLRQDNPALAKVDTHIEVAAPGLIHWQMMPRHNADLASAITQAVNRLVVGAQCHEVRLYRTEEQRWSVIVHCDFDPTLAMGEVHRRTEQIEQVLRQQFPDLDQVFIQAEPGVERGTKA